MQLAAGRFRPDPHRVGCTHNSTVQPILDSSIDNQAEGLLDASEVTLFDAVRTSCALARILFSEVGSHLLNDCIDVDAIRACYL